MKSFRKIMFWLHLIAGVFTGIFIFVMCITSALLSFEFNSWEFAESKVRVVEIPLENAQRLPIQQIIAKITKSKE